MKTIGPYKHWLFVSGVMSLAIGIVAILALREAVHEKNGFTRKFIAASLTTKAAIEKNSSITGFAGINKEQLYFTTRNPQQLFVAGPDLSNARLISTPFANANQKMASRFFIHIDSNHIDLFAGNVPAVYRAALNSPATDSFNMTGHLFSRAVKIDSGYYVFRGFDAANRMAKDQLFIKAMPGKSIVAINRNITPMLNDAGINTDGMLHYDKKNELLVFISYYNNHVYLMDNNLQLVKEAHTADTLSELQHFTGEKADGQNKSVLTNFKSKRIINEDSYVANGLLYVLSKIKSDEEPGRDFNNHAVIDRYRLKDFDYEGSFYIPDYKGQKLWGFSLTGTNLVGIYKKHIVLYNIPQ